MTLAYTAVILAGVALLLVAVLTAQPHTGRRVRPAAPVMAASTREAARLPLHHHARTARHTVPALTTVRTGC